MNKLDFRNKESYHKMVLATACKDAMNKGRSCKKRKKGDRVRQLTAGQLGWRFFLAVHQGKSLKLK